MNVAFRISRKINKNLLITVLLLGIFLLSVWNAGNHCIDRSENIKVSPRNHVKKFKSEDSSYNINDIITENELLTFKNAEVDIGLLKQICFNKIKDLKKRNVWKKLERRKPCRKNQEPDTVCLDTACSSSLPPPFSDKNFRSTFKPLYRVSDVSARISAALGPRIKPSLVTFITAASSNHFLESQALIKNLHRVVFPKLTNYSFYFYDIGLDPAQKIQLAKYCQCEVRTYPFHVLPKRFAFLRGFTWKPIIMQAHLPHTEILIWVDSSIRFRTGNLKPLFDEVRATGLLLSSVRFGLAEHTSKKMFEYFEDDACAYSIYNETEAGFQVMHNEVFVRDLFLKTWCACALDPECMCSEYGDKQFHCSSKVRSYSKCHRFDQSAYSLILAKLFRENIASFYVQKGKYHVVKRRQTAKYFDELELKRKT